MRKSIVLLFLMSLCSFMFAQNITVKQNSFQKVALSIATENLSVEDISVPNGDFSLVSMEGYVPSNNPGAPQLPVLVRFLQIPVCESVVATVTNAQYTEYDAAQLGITHPLYPNQPSVSKSAPTPPFAYDQTVYTTDEFYALPLVSVEKSGVQRDKALACMYLSPVQYNPVTQRVRIYSQIDVEFTFVNPDMAQTQQLQKYVSPMFSMDKGLLLNEQANPFKAEFSTAPIKYLIIANSMFSGNTDLEAFATWKRRLGYKVEVAYTSDANVGTTTTSIKSYIQNQYDNATAADPAPTFVLLIGDVAQIPTFTGQADNSHKTDLYYATLSGSDYIPDCYYGRLSATSAAHLTNQLAKIMMYEQYTMPDPSYLGKAVLIAGTDGTYGPTFAQGQINYAYENYVNTTSTTHNYTTVYKHDYDCSSEASTILNEINAGAGWVNYTAHGSSSGWANPSFSTSNVSTMTNTNKYGLLIGNCCQSGTFNDSECFGEALLRAQNKGAMGYIGASNYSYWYEDVYWAVGVRSSITANMSYDANNLGMYDKLFHTKTGVPTSSWVSTIGGIMYEGNQSVESSTSSRKQYYWEIYHCFGDPSVRIYLGMPNTMTVTADDITLGEDQYQVQAVPYAYVALKKNTTEFVAAAFANASGMATLTLPATLEPGTLELVVLAQNYIPYFQNVEVIEEGGCLSPSGLAVSNVTPFTANLSWNGTGTSGVFNVELKAGNADWTTVATGITATSYAFTSLQDDVEYKVRVQSVCGTETSSWRSVTFTTPVACPVPTDLTCTAFTTTTATLAWTENGSASTWVLQYGTNSNFTSGTYTQVTVNGNPTKTLTGLTAETNYYARVKASCGGIYGQSQWSDVSTFMPSAVQTVEIGSGTTNNTFLPSYSYYKYGFSQQIYTTDEITPGTIKSIAFKNTGETKTRTYSIYLQQTDKETFSSSSDWETVSSTDLVFSGELTFTAGEWTVANFSTPFVYDGTTNLLVTVSDVTGAYTNSPHMACLVYDATAQALYAYTDGSAYSISAPGTGNLLNVKNQIQLRIVPGSGASCPRPKNLSATNVTANAATLSWTESGTASNWVLQYGTNETFTAGTYTEVSVSGNPTKELTGLTAETTYYARVKSVCDANDESAWSVMCTFLPSEMTVIGSGTSTNGYLPTNNYYNYSLTQQIYTPAELGAAGNIMSVAFYKNNAVECNRNMDIYMVSTTKNEFSGTTDWITVTDADKVFSGTINFANNDWTTVTLNTPFSYDGTRNVAIIVDDNTGSYKSNTTFLAFSASNQALRVYNDGTNYDATAPSSYSGTVESTKNQIRLFIDRETHCYAPANLAASSIDHQSAVLNWTGNADSWKVAYKTSTATQFTEVTANTNSYTMTGLLPEMTYMVKVAAICSDETLWCELINFTTLPMPCPAPTALTVANVTGTSASLSWTENGTATSWVLQYGTDNTFANGTYAEMTVSGIPVAELVDLTAETQYFARVKSACSATNQSGWSNTCAFFPSIYVVIGSGTGTDNYLPTNVNNKYSMTQQIYTAEELGEAGNIVSLDFYKDNDVVSTRKLDIYMVSTDKSSFTGTNDWIPVTAADKVFSGSVSFNDNAWTTITLSRPFIYEGTSNVAIVVDDNTGLTKSSTPFRVFSATNQSIYICSNKTNYNALVAGNYAGTIMSTKNQIRIVKGELGPFCPEPTDVTVANVTRHSAVVTWTENGEADAWVVAYRPATENLFTEVEVSENSYAMTGLSIGTSYVVKVRPVCDNVTESWSEEVTFTTEDCYTISLDAQQSGEWTENFDTYTNVTTAETGIQPDCWEVVTAYASLSEATMPQVYYNTNFATSGNYTLRMKNRCVYAMPELDENVDVTALKMTFSLRQPKSIYRLQVGLVNEEGEFKLVKTINNASEDIEQVTVNFSDYEGNGHRIAFRNSLASGSSLTYSINYIDDIVISYANPCAITVLPHSENFDGYTNVTVAETGVQPECWEVIAEDVALNGATKPQVYYNTNYATSGSYVLRMKNRCTLAMPELSRNISVSGLTMTFNLRQSNSKYRLQVGVLNEDGEFELVKTIKCNGTSSMEAKTVDFSGYTGNGHRIAFRNTLVPGTGMSTTYLDYSLNYIDDINLIRATTNKGAEVTDADAMNIDRNLDIVVYPNPTKEFINVECTMNNVQSVEVIDVYGKVVSTDVGANNDSPTRINVSGLAAGMYFVRVTTDRGVVTKPFVKR